jgi:hypothetical protein
MSKLLEGFAPNIERLRDLGAVKVAADEAPDPRTDTVSIVLTMRGYEKYTMECVKRDYEEWKKVEEEFAEEDNTEELIADGWSKEEAVAWVKKRQQEHKNNLSKYNTLKKWVASDEGIGKDTYNAVLRGDLFYHLIRYGNMTRFASDMMTDETTPLLISSVERMFCNMEKTAKKEFVKLDGETAERLAKAPRLPGWIIMGNVP